MRTVLTLVVLTLSTFAAAAQPESVVVYLLRHAEPVPPPYKEDPPNPELSEAGRARAAALVQLLGDEKIGHVFSTDYNRTRETAQPLAKYLGLEVEPYDPRALEEFAMMLRSLPGRHVVVGHSNTTPRLVELLGGDPGAPIDDAREFDRLYVLVLGSGETVTTMQLRYGEPSPRK